MWSNDCQKSFDTLKQALCEEPVLAFPRFKLPFVLGTDASTTGVAAVLSQVQDGEERPIAYAAKALSKSQRKWAPTKVEMYALVFGTESFYPYLISKQFAARLDHRSLVWLQTFKQPKPQEARWVEYLQQFNMKIEQRAARLHANADGLSRRPWPANHVADMLGETENSPAPVIVGNTTRSNTTTSAEGAQSECKQTHPLPLWSNDHLKREQPKDKHLNVALQWLKAGKRPLQQEMAGVDRHMWSLWSQYDRLVLQDEVLYRRWFDEKTGHESLLLRVPQHLKGDLLHDLHDLCGHLSVLKTTDNVRKLFYWFGHSSDIELYCQTCHTCGSRNQFLAQGHPCNPLRRVIHWRGSILTFLDHFPRPIEETSMLLLWWICTQSGLKHMPCRIKRLTQWRKQSWTTLYAGSVALMEYLATRAVTLSRGFSVGCVT